LPVHDLEQLIGVSLTEEEATTASGWVTRRSGGFPKAGDVLAVGDYEMRVEEMDDTRVARLRLSRAQKPEDTSSGAQ
jgi:magnesium and cobalt transporter